MKIKFVTASVKYFTLFALLVAVALLSSMTIGAQTKRTTRQQKNAADEDYSVPCAKALRIGSGGVEDLHFKHVSPGEGDSDTDLMVRQGALKNYLACRRADTDKKMKKLSLDERGHINRRSENALRLARMRVDLIPYISFDEKFDHPVHFTITLRALALVEDHKGTLAGIYLQTKTANALGTAKAAERDEKQIEGLLARIEKISRKHNEASEFAAFKTAIEDTLREIKDDIGEEKVITTWFLVRLLQMELRD